MSLGTITSVFSDAIASAIPESSLTVSQWAATYRFLSPERSARPGRWRNELAPYLVEIMDSVGKPGVKEIVLVASAQVGKTEALSNIYGFHMHADPAPILHVAETQEKAESWSKESLAPMIRDTPVLAAIVEDARTRDSGNTITGKSFPGGHLALGWASSAATLSSRPRRIVGLDERDAFKPTSEGDPAKLAEKRTTTFPDAVVIKVSTPRDRLEPESGAPLDAQRFSPIELEYEHSDKRKYFVPCPHCDTFQTLLWSRVKWDSEEKALAAYYVCEQGCLIEHEEKAGMLARGRWQAEKPFTGRAGFHIWEGYSPFVTWGEMAKNFLEAKKTRSTFKVFVNTSLAEGWEELPEQAHTSDLAGRCEPFAAEVPAGALVLTAGVDVQGDRLEVEIVGWGLDDESWSIDYRVLDGDPARAEVWLQLQELLTQEFAFEVQVPADEEEDAAAVITRRIACACIDSGGHHTHEVYKFCRQNSGRRWFAVKGANTPGKPLVSKPSLQGRPPVKLFSLGTETAKDAISANLQIAQPGPGYCHFPAGRDENYFKQLRSERPVTRYTRGVGVRKWEKIKPSARNEALDVRVYAMAALAILRPDMRRLQRQLAEEAAAIAVRAEPATEVEPEQEADVPQPRRAPVRRRSKGFVNNW